MSETRTNTVVFAPGLEPQYPENPDLWVSWEDYHGLIDQLAVTIYQSGWEFNQILCLAKGGLRVGDLLSRLFNQPMAILAVSSYGGEGNRVRGSVTFGRDLTMTTPNLGSRVLIVDDLVDSGITMKKSLAWLDRTYGFYVEEVKTAVLWQKACSVFTPDYVVQYLPNNPWIHQPFERYETLTPSQLADQFTVELGHHHP